MNDENRQFDTLLEFLQQSRGFDLNGYKRTSLMRRFRKQMSFHEIESFADYLDYLQVHPEEFVALVNTILINVTAFLRDAPAWGCLQETVFPTLIAPTGDDLIRVWSAGCASGQEAYTIAILLIEVLGFDEFKRRVKIYATDVDNDALTQARQAVYTPKEVQDFPKNWQDRYFEVRDDVLVVHPDVRKQVIFGRHDLLQDAPISHLDLLICRNTLMYFNSEVQAKVLKRFHFALKEQGFLFLGKAEILLNHADLFVATDLRHRIFHRVPKLAPRERALTDLPELDDRVVTYQDIKHPLKLRESAFDASNIAQIVISAQGNLMFANAQARTTFELTHFDQGRLVQDLELSYRPLELRSLIEQACVEQSPVTASNVPWMRDTDNVQYFDIRIVPLEEDDVILGVSITFNDVTHYHLLREELQRTNQELETANEELHSSNEELETTNEELQSTNEELETTNEELQLSNEELESMNGKLQLTNEELVRATRKKDEFLANMSHELRTPLNAILGLTESLLEGVYGQLDSRQHKPLDTITRSGTHLLDLINDILDLTKIEAGQVALDFNFVPVASLCQSGLDLIQHQANKKNIQLVTQIPPHLPDLLLDERRIRQILVNLLNNAVKFTPDGGSVTVKVDLREDVTDTDGPESPIQQTLQISVIDTGIGIASDNLGKLFQPFSQIDSSLSRNYDGLGIGLYLVQRITALHGGDVKVISELGAGSSFTISIPCVVRPKAFPKHNL